MEHLTRIALDTNILLAIEKFKIDIFNELKKEFGKTEFIVPQQVIKELEAFQKTKKSLKKSASIALMLLEKNKAKKIKIKAENADKALIRLSSKAIIASNDKKLLEQIRQKNGKTLIIRQKKFIQLQ